MYPVRAARVHVSQQLVQWRAPVLKSLHHTYFILCDFQRTRQPLGSKYLVDIIRTTFLTWGLLHMDRFRAKCLYESIRSDVVIGRARDSAALYAYYN